MRRILCLIAILLPCACSVKENRSGCPCDLLIRPTEKLKTEGSVVVSIVQEGTVVKQEMLSREEFEAGSCVIKVNRNPTTVTVFSGITSMNLVQGRKLDIKAEHQCDEIFSCSTSADLDKEKMEYTVSLHKNFARLFLTVLNLREGMDLSISGKVSGYDLLDAAPCSGHFKCLPDGNEESKAWCIRLPRQLDDDLSLDVIIDGETVRTIALGALISATGYSFKDEDLMDITMTVDLDKSYALFGVEGWAPVTFPLIEY